MFSDVLLDHFQHPRNTGRLSDADADAEVENPICGDHLCVWLRLCNERIEEATWQAEGCAPAIAAASITSEIIRGMTVQEARSVDSTRITDALGGLPPRKAHAAALAVAALHRAIDNYTASESYGKSVQENV